MLFDLKRNAITHQPYAANWHALRMRLIEEEQNRIHAALDEYTARKNVVISSWIPGPVVTWEHTPYGPLLRAANNDAQLAAKFFGLTVWYHFAGRLDAWITRRYVDGRTRCRMYRRMTEAQAD